MSYKVSTTVENGKVLELFIGKQLELIKDNFTSILAPIMNIELKENLFITFNKSDFTFENLQNAHDEDSSSLIKLLKLNTSSNKNEVTFLVKDIKENCSFIRSYKRESILGTKINLLFKNVYDEKKEIELEGHDLSGGGISFLIDADNVHSINEYLSVSSKELNFYRKKIELKNMRLIDSKFLIGTKFI